MTRSISLTAPGILSVYRRRCIARGGFIRAASNPVNRSIWRLAWKVRRRVPGFSTALFQPPNGGTTLFSPEATCFSSGRKNGFGSGAPRMVIRCGRSSRWTSYGRSRPLGILTRRSLGEGGSTRLQENSRRPQPDEMRSIFAGIGLGGDFWDPQSDTFSRGEL